jgi:hypothetical protein
MVVFHSSGPSFRFLISCVTNTILVATLAVAVPAFPQETETQSPSACDQKKQLPDYWKELKSSPRSSLANYCMAELLLDKREYQASANAYRSSLSGDGSPSWTKVWSHIQLGKIFDITEQRDRAVNQYQLARETGDDTRGAMKQARELLDHPFKWPGNQ